MDFDNTQAINELIANPPPLKPAATTQKWNAWSAPLRAVAAGVAEMAGTLSSIQPQMDTNRPMPEILLEEQRRWQQRYGDRTESQVMRDVARDLRPDPNTAGLAENIVFGLGRGLTKGALYLGAGGPILGPVGFGVDEGATTAADLQQQGVDANTALKAGVAAGVGGAVGLALPMAGSTVGRTVGLWAVGGPGAFVAQQAATQSILREADYGRIAESYDPLDPVGLAVAALVPGVFAGVHVRNLAKGGVAKSAENSPSGAPAPQAINASRASPIDAARVALIRETVDSWNLGSAAEVRAAAAHLESVVRSNDRSPATRDSTVDLVPLDRAEAATAMDRMIESLQAARTEMMVQAADLAEPGAVRAMRDELAQLQAAQVDTSPEAIRALAKEIQAADGVSYKSALSKARKVIDEQAAQQDARITRLEDAIGRNAEAQRATQDLQQLDRGIADLQAERALVDAPVGSALSPVAAAARQFAENSAFRGLDQETLDAAMTHNLTAQADELVKLPAEAMPDDVPVPAAAAKRTPQAEQALTPEAARPAAEQAIDLQTVAPDLPVRVADDGRLVTVDEEMNAVRQEARNGSDFELGHDDAPLLQVAAECFLTL